MPLSVPATPVHPLVHAELEQDLDPGRDVLRAQLRRRVGIGAPVVLGLFMLQLLRVAGPAAGALAWTGGAYVAYMGAILGVLSGRPRAWAPLAFAVLVGDVALAILSTIATSPDHLERILILSFLVLHVADSSYGTRQALGVLALVTGAFTAVVLLAAQSHPTLEVTQALITCVIFTSAGGLYIARTAATRQRLHALATLFAHAEQGDLTATYDLTRDRIPDAITLLGRSYNRVRDQLESMVLSDPLTGCLNRRGFDQAIAREAARATRAGSMLALLALDLDHFKDVNDTHGHQAGDDVLREAAELLQQCARAGDVVARTGGEEFAIILPDTDARGAFQLASRICECVRSHRFAAGNGAAGLTASIGVAAESPVRGMDTESILTGRADEALYAAKRSGRDRVRAWSPESLSRRSGELSSLA